jgi:hypothetical protein
MTIVSSVSLVTTNSSSGPIWQALKIRDVTIINPANLAAAHERSAANLMESPSEGG